MQIYESNNKNFAKYIVLWPPQTPQDMLHLVDDRLSTNTLNEINYLNGTRGKFGSLCIFL